MSRVIELQTRTEHANLVSLIDKLITSIMRLPRDIKWGDSQWMEDLEILDFIRIQVLSLRNAKSNVLQGYYRDSYHLIRMVFEGYFTLRLISMCCKYPVRVKIRKSNTDPTGNIAQQNVITRLKQKFGDDLLDTYMEDSKTLVAIVRGIHVVDDKGNKTGVMIPFYYGAWRDFRPIEYHLRREGLQERIPTRRFLNGDWMGAPRKTRTDVIEHYANLYRYFLTFERILDNLRLNGVLNKKTSTRVLVHYNFLSSYSHSTSDSISIAKTRKLHQFSSSGLDVVYDHYLSELALLYICHLLTMHLQYAIHYLDWRSIELRHKGKYYRALCKRVDNEFGYFWFIYNKPHQYDRYVHANHKCNYKKRLFFRPEQIRPGDVRYYENPLYRLKQLHQSQQELTTGNMFVSPFPRNDA
jgi:hypothetical protein